MRTAIANNLPCGLFIFFLIYLSDGISLATRTHLQYAAIWIDSPFYMHSMELIYVAWMRFVHKNGKTHYIWIVQIIIIYCHVNNTSDALCSSCLHCEKSSNLRVDALSDHGWSFSCDTSRRFGPTDEILRNNRRDYKHNYYAIDPSVEIPYGEWGESIVVRAEDIAATVLCILSRDLTVSQLMQRSNFKSKAQVKSRARRLIRQLCVCSDFTFSPH